LFLEKKATLERCSHNIPQTPKLLEIFPIRDPKPLQKTPNIHSQSKPKRTTQIFTQEKIEIKRERKGTTQTSTKKRACANTIVSSLIELTKMVRNDEIKWKLISKSNRKVFIICNGKLIRKSNTKLFLISNGKLFPCLFKLQKIVVYQMKIENEKEV